MLTVKQTVAALKERDLFKEIIVDGQWQYDVPRSCSCSIQSIVAAPS